MVWPCLKKCQNESGNTNIPCKIRRNTTSIKLGVYKRGNIQNTKENLLKIKNEPPGRLANPKWPSLNTHTYEQHYMAIGFYLYVHVCMCVTTIIKEEVMRLRGREGGVERESVG